MDIKRKKIDLVAIINPYNYVGEHKNDLFYSKDKKIPDINYIMDKFGLNLDFNYYEDKESQDQKVVL